MEFKADCIDSVMYRHIWKNELGFLPIQISYNEVLLATFVLCNGHKIHWIYFLMAPIWNLQ